MRTTDYTGQFKRDYRREKKGRYRALLDAELYAVLAALQAVFRWRRSTAITR